ncbi:MAG TPA: hypothetical protein VJ720_07690, partial [Chitinophaga sp.]|nr:hypothetical protein [Chitinophaga sp.]
MKYILLLIFLPAVASAQVMSPVRPILSGDYTGQVRKLRGQNDPVDSVSNRRNTVMTLEGIFDPRLPVYKMKTTKNQVEILPRLEKYLDIAGSFSTYVEVKTANRQPDLQHSYAQGRPVNGTPTWRGPETGEMFSYGPAMQLLEFDGTAYAYDKYGRLTAAGTGNGNKAHIYNNNILRTATSLSQSLNVQGDLYRYGKRTWNFNMKMAHTGNQTLIRDTKDNTMTFGAGAGTSIKWFKVSGNYTHVHTDASNGNRNGFLNRVWQNALLTPVSFDN